MTQVNLHDARTAAGAADLLEDAPARRTPGTAKGDFVVPTDFDHPLPEAILSAFEARRPGDSGVA
jgi:antitoxin (DNA-binding transcriptional repressor) of toxin-antitoxin stability system